MFLFGKSNINTITILPGLQYFISIEFADVITECRLGAKNLRDPIIFQTFDNIYYIVDVHILNESYSEKGFFFCFNPVGVRSFIKKSKRKGKFKRTHLAPPLSLFFDIGSGAYEPPLVTDIYNTPR